MAITKFKFMRNVPQKINLIKYLKSIQFNSIKVTENVRTIWII